MARVAGVWLVDVAVEAWVDGIELATDSVDEDGANCSESGKEEENAAKADEGGNAA